MLAINSQAYQDFCSEDVEEQVWTSDPILGLATMKEPNALAAAAVSYTHLTLPTILLV